MNIIRTVSGQVPSLVFIRDASIAAWKVAPRHVVRRGQESSYYIEQGNEPVYPKTFDILSGNVQGEGQEFDQLSFDFIYPENQPEIKKMDTEENYSPPKAKEIKRTHDEIQQPNN